jgi:hypothetical protein
VIIMTLLRSINLPGKSIPRSDADAMPKVFSDEANFGHWPASRISSGPFPNIAAKKKKKPPEGGSSIVTR